MIYLGLLLAIILRAAFAFDATELSYDVRDSTSDLRKLKVGQELFGERLTLQMGRCVYDVEGLESSKWYEVKISYPASIPARFTIELLKEGSFPSIRGGRRLLNTEKLVFREDENQGAEVIGGLPSAHVLVTVEPDGVVAKRQAKEQPFIIYNILCEEVRFGIPMQAWLIGILGAAAIIISTIAPSFLPRHLLPRKYKEPVRKQYS